MIQELKTTDLGGFDFCWDDFRWAFNGVRGSLKAFYDKLNGGNFILSGCQITPAGAGQVDVAAGFIVLGGIIRKVDAHTAPANGNWVGYSDFHPDGLILFQNGQNLNTYEVFMARVEASAGFAIAPRLTFEDALYSLMNGFVSINQQQFIDAVTQTVLPGFAYGEVWHIANYGPKHIEVDLINAQNAIYSLGNALPGTEYSVHVIDNYIHQGNSPLTFILNSTAAFPPFQPIKFHAVGGDYPFMAQIGKTIKFRKQTNYWELLE
jgi:hypothetical protein